MSILQRGILAMQVPFERSIAQRAVVAGVTIATVAVLSLVAAYWTWQWFAPRPESRAQAGGDNGGGAAVGGLFGTAAKERNTGAPTGIAIRLLGIVAATSGRKGYAVMEVEPRQILAVHEGDDVVAGVRLAQIEPDHVTLERNGRQETLTWPEKNKPAEPTPVRTNR
jgi:general secretion pathway protein C